MTRDYSQFLPSAAPDAAPRRLTLLETLGWQPYFAQQIELEDLVKTPPVRVTEVHRNGLRVVGDGVDTTLPPGPDATVGDWLLHDAARPGSSRVLQRKSLFKRRAAGTGRDIQLIAANVDTAMIVSSCNHDFNVARLERFVALAFDAGAAPVIVLTKADQCDGPERYLEAARTIADEVPALALDARGEAPKAALAAWCKPGRTVAFLGSSGVGKSTLINTLSGTDAIETATIREDDSKGRHTTTRRQLHVLPAGCAVIDTPGMRELRLTDVAAGIADVFSDLHALAAACRFGNCRHVTEPGCAVLAAVENGDVGADRLARWRKLAAEERHNAASLAERRAKDKAFGKTIRLIQKLKKK